jgi:hypothetical protein
MQRKRVVRVTATEFELDNGDVYPHPIELEEVPTPEEFQRHYDYWFNVFEELADGEAVNDRTSCTYA